MGRSIVGPLCFSRFGHEWIDSGTLCLTRCSAPGAIGLKRDAASHRLSIEADLPHRLLRAARAGLPYFSNDVRDKISAALTLENMAFLCAGIAADIAFSGTGAGLVINVILGAAVVVFVGADALHGCSRLGSFYYLAKAAKSNEDFAKAGAEFARGVTTLGIDTALVLLTLRAGRTLNGEIAAPTAEKEVAAGVMTTAAVLSRWSTYIGELDLRVAANRGALWSKLFDEPSLPTAAKSALSDGDVATALAAQDGRSTLESKLAASDFWQRYRTEFPDINGKPVWDPRTKGIWKMLSEKYASALEGDVVAYVDSDEVINSINKGEPPILTDELKIINAQVLKNRRITSVTFQDVWTRKRTKALSRQTLETGIRLFN